MPLLSKMSTEMKISDLNYDHIFKLCRVCLEKKENLYSIFDEIVLEGSGSKITIHDLLISVVQSFVVENRFPSQICDECTSLLKASCTFMQRYSGSTDILNKYLQSKETVLLTYTSQNMSDTTFLKSHSGNLLEYSLNENVYSPTTEETVSKSYDNLKETTSLHPCPICTREFTALDLKDHLHSHKALKNYLQAAAHVSKDVKYFATPRQTVSLFNLKQIQHNCPFCNEGFSAENFGQHVNSHRTQNEFKCDKCSRVFRRLNHLNVHRIKHMKEYPYKCKECGKGFVIKHNYECHVLLHTNSELPHECMFCQKRFSNPEHLNRHTLIHTENISYATKYKVLKCYHCKKSFQDKNELEKHECNHVKEYSSNASYPCRHCNKIFKHTSSLHNHNKTMHKIKEQKTLCSVCGSYVANIYSHMLRHSGQKPFSCNQCEKRFFSKPQLKQHLLVHSGLKPFVCSICAKAFNNLYNLQVHERIHKGDRCHICSVCNKGFLEKSYLKKHMSTHKHV